MSGLKKYIIIDCQLLQTEDRYRGMGLYFYNLLYSINKKHPKNVNFKFLINSNLRELSIEDRNLLKDLGDIENVKLLTSHNHQFFSQVSANNRKVIDKFVSEYKEKVIFFIPSLFSSEIFPVFPTKGTLNLLLFYDIIPFLYADQYFKQPDGNHAKDYSQRWGEAYKTDLFLTISITTADDLSIYFGIDPSRIIPIFGAGAHANKIVPQKPKIKGLSRDFILMPSGDDYRKNNILAVRAFADLNTNTKLLITSKFSSETKHQLRNISSNVIFSESVSNNEMVWLIDNALFVFFPSQYEGLGMPILEAVNRNAKIVCSDIPAFKEISEKAFHYFDPLSQKSITLSLRRALKEYDESNINSQSYALIKDQFNWDKVSQRFIDSLEHIQPAPEKKKMAVFCPSPSSYSAVGKYVFEVHGELSRYFDIDYYCENGLTEIDQTRLNILEYATNYNKVSDFNFKKNNYDKVLYHIGNSEFHAETILSSLKYSANTIIHDTFLNGIFDYMLRNGYLIKERRELENIINKKINKNSSSCLGSIVTNQKLNLTHSQYSMEAVSSYKDISKNLEVKEIFHPVAVPRNVPSKDNKFIVSFAGIISEAKGINLVSDISKIDQDMNVRIFGYGVLGDSPLLNNLGDNIELKKDLTDKDFQELLSTTDVLINYRLSYHGETSRSVLEAMRYGVVVIVKNIGWFSELPDQVVVKVTSELDLFNAVKELKENPERRELIGNNAREFLSNNYSFSKYSNKIAKILKDNK